MSGSNPSESDPPRGGSENPRNQDRPANSGAQPLISFDDILIDMPDRLPVGDPDDPERLKREKKEKSMRVAFKRAILKVDRSLMSSEFWEFGEVSRKKTRIRET